jgi:acetyltransferase-like isoleucine patch superfamily enzyme
MIIEFLKKVTKFMQKRESNLNLQYSSNGNLKVGDNCIINNLVIEILHDEKNCNNIILGNDCNLSGSLSIYSPNAKIIIGNRVFIGPQTKLISYEEIKIDDDVMISWDCTIMDTNAHSLISIERENDVLDWNRGFEFKKWNNVESKKIHINRNSWLGFKSIILKGVEIGKGTVVASGSVVTKNTEQYSIVAGNPARFIRKTK